MRPAIFLDRDGTIIKEKGYIADIRDVVFYDYTFNCLRELQNRFILFILTNQPGIGKGIISKNDVENIHSYILQKMQDHGIAIKEIFCCGHKKEDRCPCRKPGTFFIDNAKDKYSIDINGSYVIGDHPSDAELAINAKANGIYLLTGHGRKHYHDLNDNIKSKITICRTLEFAARLIQKKFN
jgi:D-glycero-D-manno-heptose 1,7-bisphosphate phosphatase